MEQYLVDTNSKILTTSLAESEQRRSAVATGQLYSAAFGNPRYIQITQTMPAIFNRVWKPNVGTFKSPNPVH